MLESHLVWAVEAQIGEGPIWIGGSAMLWFVDIKLGLVHRFEPATGERHTVAVGGSPSFIVPADDGILLVGDGNAIRPFRDGVLGDPVARVAMPATNRTNDATVDPAGRLWFGTMDDGETERSGAVHLFDGASVRVAGGESVITNGPAVSPDGRYLYHVDTLERTIWRFDIARGDQLVGGEIFATIANEDGTPDGVTIDSEACLWVALWGGWQVRRYAPDGELLARVALPCAQVTKIAFGGADLRTAFVTTARIGLSEAELADQPLAGGLFAFDVEVPGLPTARVRMAR
jgi:sugar lactone lactonase YvrE